MGKWELLEITEGTTGYRPRFVHRYKSPDGIEVSFDMVGGREGVSIFALTTDGQIIFVTQFRPGPLAITTELPGGGIDEGELPSEAAIRELLEETGFAGDGPILLGTTHSPYSLHRNYSYFIDNCVKVAEQNLDPTEDAVCASMPLEAFIEYVLPTYTSPDLSTIYRGIEYALKD